MGRDRKLGIEAHPTGFKLVEQQIQRHHLGERGGVGPCIGIGGVQDRSRFGIDDDGGVPTGGRGPGQGDQTENGDNRPQKGMTERGEESGADQVQRLDLPISVQFG